MPNKKTEKIPELAKVIIAGIQEVKGHEIVYINLSKLEQRCCDHFVICHGDSFTQVASIAGAVERETREKIGEKPLHREGVANAEWALLDYGNVVVHIFHREKRDHYNIEGLWADGDLIAIEDEEKVYGE